MNNKNKIIISIAALTLLTTITVSANERIVKYILPESSISYKEKENQKTIVLDYSHSDSKTNTYRDNGAESKIDGTTEREVTNKLTKTVGDKLELKGFKVIYTRDIDGTVSIPERVKFANKIKGDLYLSIHANITDEPISTTSKGIEAFSNNAWSISNSILINASEGLGMVNRGVIATRWYNREIKYPSLLLEIGFLNNENDLDIIKNKQEEYSDIIVESIVGNLK